MKLLDDFNKLSPHGFKIVVFISLLPVLLWPLLMVNASQLQSSTQRFLMLTMPVYALASGYLAHRCYDERPYVSWVILAVLWLSYIAFTLMVCVH